MSRFFRNDQASRFAQVTRAAESGAPMLPNVSLAPGVLGASAMPSTMKALMHVTLPALGPHSPEYHFAPLVFLLEGMIAVNRYHIAQAMKRAEMGLGAPIPPLYASGVVYKEDPPGQENWRDVYSVIAQGTGDCLPVSTLVLRDDFELVPMLCLRPGDRIMGADSWTSVQEVAITGEKSILEFDLSNGCTLRCSPDHRLFRDVNGQMEEVRASQVTIGDDLVTPRSVPLATGPRTGTPLDALAPEDRAWLLGAFVADGWTEERRSAISGLDGKPKEEQKRRVQALMESIRVHTRWHERYIAINDQAIAQFFTTCGRHAPNKRIPSAAYGSEPEVRALIDGLAADSGVAGRSNSRVFGTTSATLALQLRVLHRMLGISTSIRRVADHGGLGTHPIYRVIPRMKIAEGSAERRDKRFARVRAIANGGVDLCADITTDTGKFWLPESDVLVHNCDNLVIWRTAELREAGIDAQPAIKWQHLDHATAVQCGYPASFVPPEGLWLVHCSVQWPDGRIEDVSKNLGMGGNFTRQV